MSTAQPESSKPTALNLQLVGVLAATPRRLPSLAILNLDNKGNEVFREGSDISTGVVLHQITRTHVVIRRQGNLERVEFSTPLPGPKGIPVLPAGFKLQVPQQGSGQFSFSRQDLNHALQDPGQLAQLGRLTIKPEGGVIIEQAPPGSLAQKLSLQDGDVITSVNRETVSSSEDLMRLYQKFTNTGQVTLEGSRKGAPLKQTYTVKP